MKGKRRRQIQKEMEFKIEELEKEVEDFKDRIRYKLGAVLHLDNNNINYFS